MKALHEKYLNIIRKCKFVSKEDEWFVEGTECVLLDECIYPDYIEGNTFNAVDGMFGGLTMEIYNGFRGDLPRYDSESCPLEEFLIYDELGNEISELTLEQYESILKFN